MMLHLALAYLSMAPGLRQGSGGQAQEPRSAFPAPPAAIAVASDVEYGMSGATRLAMEVYKPAGAQGRDPALVFFNRATGGDRSQPFFAASARAAASKGIIAILPDLRSGSEAADFRVLMAYLAQHGAGQGIDAILRFRP